MRKYKVRFLRNPNKISQRLKFSRYKKQIELNKAIRYTDNLICATKYKISVEREYVHIFTNEKFSFLNFFSISCIRIYIYLSFTRFSIYFPIRSLL